MNIRKDLLFGFLWVAISLTAGGNLRAAGLEADMVIYNGKILTADSPDPENFRTAQAAAIYDGKFIAVGSDAEAMQYAGTNTKKIDLAGRTVIPGLIETHLHIYDTASHFFPPEAERVAQTDPAFRFANKGDFLASIKAVAAKKKPGEWIISSLGGDLAAMQQGAVTRAELDQAAPNNPLYLHWEVLVWGLMNSKAEDPLLARYPKVEGIMRDAKGNPNGLVTGNANPLYWYEFLPQVSPAKIGPYYKMEMDEIAAQGITSVSTRLLPNHLAAYSWLHARGEMPIRLPYTLEALSRSEMTDAIASRIIGLQGGSGKDFWGAGDDWLWIIGVTPISLDSLVGSGSACVRQPYPRESANFPMWKFQFYGPYGLCRLQSDQYPDADVIKKIGENGFRITGLHVGGDRAIDELMDSMEKMEQTYPDIAQRRWAIDHCEAVHEDQIQRAKKLGVMFSCAPSYLWGGEHGAVGAFSEIYKSPDIAGNAVIPLRGMIDAGLHPVIELDSHAFHPMLALQVYITRKDSTGRVWGPKQAISRQEALYAYTRWSSEYVLRENKLGSIEPKKLADFVVLDKDYLTVPELEIGRIDSLLTVVDGKVVYSDPAFAASQSLPVVGYQGDRSRWTRGDPNARRPSGPGAPAGGGRGGTPGGEG